MYIHLNVRDHVHSLNALVRAADSDVANVVQSGVLHEYSTELRDAFTKLCAEVRSHEYGFGLLNLLGQAWRRFIGYDWRFQTDFNSAPKSTEKFAAFLREILDEQTLKERTKLLELSSTLGIDAIAYANEEIKALCSQKLAETGLLTAAAA